MTALTTTLLAEGATLGLYLAPMLTATIAACTCALLGNFLLLRRLSMLGDAISHAILPGIVITFLLFSVRNTYAMLLGATIAGAASVLLIELVRRLGKVEAGAAMGVIFAGMFALGVLLMQRFARNVDLDPGCVLYGNLEGILWLELRSFDQLLSPAFWLGAPRELLGVIALGASALLVVIVFFKVLRLAAFDPALSNTLGFPSWIINTGLTLMVAASAVGAFEAVGSILVIAMLVCPPAAARQLTDKLATQLVLSVLIAAGSAIVGFLLAVEAPGWFGFEHAVSAPGSIALVCGVALVASIVCSPQRGVIARWVRRRRLDVEMAREDVLAWMYRAEEEAAGVVASGSVPTLTPGAPGVPGGWALRRARAQLARQGLIDASGASLSPTGRQAARDVVRAHRLWETYLVNEAGQRPDHVHRSAMTLEHLRDDATGQRLSEEINPPGARNRTNAPGDARSPEAPAVDPHAKPIPPKEG